jgi:hypothetical protein
MFSAPSERKTVPLKEADLKDTDSYKKASRMDMPKVAAGNAKFFVYKDVELPNSSGKKQKYPAFLALVDDNGIRKALTGKKLICKGTCGIKEERIAFEPATGKVPYKQLKVSVPLLLGKGVWIPAGMEDEGSEGEGTETGVSPEGGIPTPPTAPPIPPVQGESLAAVWGKLTKDAQAYAAAHPERKEALFREMAAIADLLKANKAAEAKPKMDHVRALLDAPVAPPPPTGHPDAAAQVAARWSALVKQLQAESTAHPEKKADLVRASAGIADMIRAGKLELASKLMDTVDATLRGDPKELEYRKRYRAIEGRLADALKDPAHDASRLRAMDAFIVEKAGARDFDAALKALQNLEEALETAGGVPKPEPEREPPTESENVGSESEVGLVEFAKLRLRWQEAKKAVAGELSELEKMVRSEMADDPMLGNLKRLAEILKVFNEGLSDALDNLANADTPEKRRAAAGVAQKAADHYMDHVVDDELIEYVEDNPFTETRISGHLLPPLSAISAALGLMSHGS